MSSLSVEQIVKIVVAVFVLVLVLGGVYIVFKDKINSFFGDIVPEKEPDLETPFYKELVQDKNLVATVPERDDIGYITLNGGRRTEYYIKKGTAKIKRDVKFAGEWSWRGVFGKDEVVGEIEGNGKIVIFEKFADNAELKQIEGGEKIGGGIYRVR